MYQHIIFDRDGTINDGSHYYVTKSEDFSLLANAKEGLLALKEQGKSLYIFTQQSCINKGELTEEGLKEIHAKMNDLLGSTIFEDILHCPHIESDNCNCRKPKTGMLEILAGTYDLKKENTLVVGDAERDYLSAKAMGYDFCLVRTGKGADLESALLNEATYIVDDLLALSEAIE